MHNHTRYGKRSILAATALVTLGLSGIAGAQVIGFGGTANSTSQNATWTLNAGGVAAANGVPNVVGSGTISDVLTLTTATNGESASAWFNTPQTISYFTESFTYTDNSTNGADGLAIVWQNASSPLSALGGGGGSLGYGGISNSAALAMNIYSGNSGSASEYDTAFQSGGNPAITPTPGGVNLDSGDPINVSLSYKESDNALTETMTDASHPSETFTRVWNNISIQSAVGGSTAYIGITAGTGGINAKQSVTNFQFTPSAANPTPTPTITPIPGLTGWDQNMIVSAANGIANMTATQDNGPAGITNLSSYNTGNNNSFAEKGVDSGNGGNEGVPRAGVVFDSANDSNHSFVFQPNVPGQDDAVLLNKNITAGALSFIGNTAYSILSFLVSGGNGGANVSLTINYANGGIQTTTINVPDWFNGTNPPIAWAANGRVSAGPTAGNLGYNNEDGGNPRLYQDDVTLSDTTDAVTGVSFTYAGSTTGGNSAIIYGISGTAVPEPASFGLLALGTIGALARRRRSIR